MPSDAVIFLSEPMSIVTVLMAVRAATHHYWNSMPQCIIGNNSLTTCCNNAVRVGAVLHSLDYSALAITTILSRSVAHSQNTRLPMMVDEKY